MRTGLYSLASLLLISPACSSSGNVQCTDDANCNSSAGGACLENPATGNQWCAYPDGECPSGSRWSDQDVGDGLGGRCVSDDVDPPPDAGPDGNDGGGEVVCLPRIAFHDGAYSFSPAVATREVYVSNLDGTGLVNISNSPTKDDYNATWAPDGIRIAFQSNRAGNYDIFIVRADGSGLRNLTEGSSIDEQRPIWSPDGTKIAYLKGLTPWVMTLDGLGPVQVSNRTVAAPLTGPAMAWSPDSTKLVYPSSAPNVPDLWVSTLVAGSQPANITNTPGEADGAPSWAPNVRIASAPTGGDIVTMDGNGAGRLNVTNSPESDSWPVWSTTGDFFFSTLREGIGAHSIWRLAGTGGSPTRVTSNALTMSIQGDFVGDVAKGGGSVAFERRISDSQSQVGVVSANGMDEKLFSASNNARHPSFAKCP